MELVAWFVLAVYIRNKELLRLRNKEYMEAFASHLQSLGVAIKTDVSTKVIGRDDSGISISTGGNEVVHFDKLVLAVPPNAAAMASACL